MPARVIRKNGARGERAAGVMPRRDLLARVSASLPSPSLRFFLRGALRAASSDSRTSRRVPSRPSVVLSRLLPSPSTAQPTDSTPPFRFFRLSPPYPCTLLFLSFFSALPIRPTLLRSGSWIHLCVLFFSRFSISLS